MGKFQVISGTEKKSYKPSGKDYALAFAKKIRDCSSGIESRDDIIKIVFLFVKASARYNLNGLTKQEIELRISSIQTIHELISKLTPAEFIRAFPITKKYDGEKYSMRDYYSTVEALKKYPPDSEIGSDNVISFLMDYDNPDIMEFVVHKLSVISAWRRLSGQPGVMEEFMMGARDSFLYLLRGRGNHGRKRDGEGNQGFEAEKENPEVDPNNTGWIRKRQSSRIRK